MWEVSLGESIKWSRMYQISAQHSNWYQMFCYSRLGSPVLSDWGEIHTRPPHSWFICPTLKFSLPYCILYQVLVEGLAGGGSPDDSNTTISYLLTYILLNWEILKLIFLLFTLHLILFQWWIRYQILSLYFNYDIIGFRIFLISQ